MARTSRRGLLLGGLAALAGLFLPRLRRQPVVTLRISNRVDPGKGLGWLGADVVNVGGGLEVEYWTSGERVYASDELIVHHLRARRLMLEALR